MMRLKFSVEDILRAEKVTNKMASQESSSMECLELMTSDGESPRSESPDSVASTNSDGTDAKGGRRIRTMIQGWQKNCLETVFEQQQYPTVHQCEGLSKKLGLPHYVTKVWFQNRRSKFRKEGSRKLVRNSVGPYPVRVDDDANRQDEVPGPKIPAEKTRAKTQERKEPVAAREKTCNCPECNEALVKARADERLSLEAMPRLEVCNCRDCIARMVAYRQQQQHFEQQQYMEKQRLYSGSVVQQRMERNIQLNTSPRQSNERQNELDLYQEKKNSCGCSECIMELHRARNEQVELIGKAGRFYSPEQQCMPPFLERNFDDKIGKSHGTLHYVPQNLDSGYNRDQNGQCLCKECCPQTSYFK